MAVLVLPLTIPVLIFGVAAASAASGGAAPFLDAVPDAVRAVARRHRRCARSPPRRRSGTCGSDDPRGACVRLSRMADWLAVEDNGGPAGGTFAGRAAKAAGENFVEGMRMNRLYGWMDSTRPLILSILRIVTALVFLQYGLSKAFGFPDHGPPSLTALLMVAAALESVGSVMLVLGAYTRIVAFILSGEMAVAYFMAHAPRSFYPIVNGGNAAILFCFVFLYLAFAGGGPLSLDRDFAEAEVAPRARFDRTWRRARLDSGGRRARSARTRRQGEET